MNEIFDILEFLNFCMQQNLKVFYNLYEDFLGNFFQIKQIVVFIGPLWYFLKINPHTIVLTVSPWFLINFY